MSVYNDFYQTLQRFVQGYVESLHSLSGVWVDWSLADLPAFLSRQRTKSLLDLLIGGEAVSKDSKSLFIQTVQSIFKLPYPVTLQPWFFRFQSEKDYDRVATPTLHTVSDPTGRSIKIYFFNDKILNLKFETAISNRYNFQMQLMPLIRKAATPFWYYGHTFFTFKYDLHAKKIYDLINTSQVSLQNIKAEEIEQQLKRFSILEPGLSPFLYDPNVKLVYFYKWDNKPFLCEFYIEDPDVVSRVDNLELNWLFSFMIA